MQKLQHVGAATLITNPASDADVHIQIQVVVKLMLLTSEAMYNATCGQGIAIGFQYGQKTRMRIALMQKDGLACLNCQFQVLLEGFFLVWSRRKIAVEIKAGFADGFYTGVTSLGTDTRKGFGIAVVRFVGVNAGGSGEKCWILLGQGDGSVAGIRTGASDQQVNYSSRPGSFKDGFEIFGEGLMPEIRANVDQRRRRDVKHY